MRAKRYFITGIGTDVGKTVAAAIITESLHADYWKPVQAGDLSNCDTKKVASLVSNKHSVFHENSYALTAPMSPHAAAEIDGLTIDLSKIHEPNTTNHLVIEGAGGLLVPLNSTNTILDLIKPSYTVVVVSRHYLGSINHTLLTLQLLKEQGHEVLLIFSGDEHPSTESIIKKMSGVTVIGRIEEEPYFDQNVVRYYAEQFKPYL